jgi:hypothetical protein
MKKPLIAATGHSIVNTSMGILPSTSAIRGAKLESARDVRLQAPIAVTANRVGKIYALAI